MVATFATYKACIKGHHHIAMASACGGFVQRRTFYGVAHQIIMGGAQADILIASWVATRAGQLRPGYLRYARQLHHVKRFCWPGAAFIT